METLDLKKIIKDKSPRLAKWLPGFVLSYIRRTIHEDELNNFLLTNGHLSTIGFIRATLNDMGLTYNAPGLAELDPAGRYIFASNHPFGGLDGLMLADKVSERFGDVRVVVNDLLMNIEPLYPIFIPVNKHGRQKPEYVKKYNDAFESDVPIITFPAGVCSRRKKGVVCDSLWKPNFVKQAIATKRDVVPVFFEGSLSNFFYRLHNVRTRLGIKANLEMFYLSDEMFRQQGEHFEIKIGDPIPWEELRDKHPREASLEIRTKAYSLK